MQLPKRAEPRAQAPREADPSARHRYGIRSIEVDPAGRWVRIDGRATVSFAHRPRLCPMLARLWEAHVETPGRYVSAAELAEATWPGEKIDAVRAKNRVRFTIWALRSYGLRNVIQSTTRGYRLRAEVPPAPRISEVRELRPRIALSIDD